MPSLIFLVLPMIYFCPRADEALTISSDVGVWRALDVRVDFWRTAVNSDHGSPRVIGMAWRRRTSTVIFAQSDGTEANSSTAGRVAFLSKEALNKLQFEIRSVIL